MGDNCSLLVHYKRSIQSGGVIESKSWKDSETAAWPISLPL